MAKLFLVYIGNGMDDNSRAVPVIVPDYHTSQDVQSGIDCGDIKLKLDEWSSEFVRWIEPVKPLFNCFDEDEFREIEPVLKEFGLLKN